MIRRNGGPEERWRALTRFDAVERWSGETEERRTGGAVCRMCSRVSVSVRVSSRVFACVRV